MKIGIISDHRGYDLRKEIIKNYKEHELVDLGAESKNAEEVDYPDYAFLLGEKVASGELDYGVAICASGIGISIACNKVKGIRCAKIDSVKDIIATRSDNDANIIAFSSDKSLEEAINYIHTFLTTPFNPLERYKKRNLKIKNYEEGKR